MAEISAHDGELVLHLSGWEKVEGASGDLRAPLSAVRGAEVVDDAHRAALVLGIKIGTRIPYIVEVASVETASKRVFVAVHRDTPRGVRVLFDGAGYDEWIVGSTDPEGLLATLGLPVV